MMGYGGMGWSGMGVGGMFAMVVFWILLIAAVVWAVSRLLPGRRPQDRATQPGQEAPEEILDRRFARGEVDLETYQAQRAALVSARGERLR